MPPGEFVRLLVPLLAAVYLGFYVFALVMGVFGPGEVLGFTLIAGVCVLVLVAVSLAHRRGIDPVRESSPTIRKMRADREKRGW